MKKIKLTVLTPDRTLLSSKETESITIPAFEGEMGILPGHAPYIVQLKEGILRYKAGGKEDFMAIFWGFARIKGDEVTVLTEMGELVKEINEEKARQEYQRAKDAMNMKGADLDLDSAQASIKKAIVRIKVAELRRKRNI
ncbi:MAG: ATP synthase F1 subunit epsilon [Elusimicrobia bacterium CG08_land_8_20_14_0_20_51_18]|nr:MAG: ATP synthase F1 subunit epsilon [Elusimicrobia bacterium CG08_land_8_20_14_0_20_51_18]